jgi:hypothetical protein
MLQIGKVFYRVSIAPMGASKLLYVTHYYLDTMSEDGQITFRELVKLDLEWRISPTPTIFGDGTKEAALRFLVTREGLAAKISEVSSELE